ncbi:norsolorinic acid reductase [Protomyces lactucae-debilis]|uniref:Norsolorinic acid reductase n=1 Tax=Protomyces lactucae-debilis TaxID=2754530 RepID=A0A1Y2FCH3_PROLT|nr:norsolorinic acid reductase [Protomyces lactucae-debilis]ORY81016.1 norsolorinic acid reductase [Protomyces lactucae-debilis]
MSLFAPYPDPPSALGRLRVLSPNAAIRVSPLCLGTMTFGTAWSENMGDMTKETAFEIMDLFFKQGGSFFDTANNYQSEESETWIGEWMAARKNRDQITLATKYTSPYNTHDKSIGIHANFTGNHVKSLRLSVAASLAKLKTDYIDLLYVHWWDHTTSIPELMQSLNQLITAGKVLYLGISDTPAWIVVKANMYAEAHGLRGFSVYQGQWSAAKRDVERDILPMCRDMGLAMCPWGALGGGNFKTDEQRKQQADKGRNFRPATEADVAVTKVLSELSEAKGKSITSLALAYVLHSQPYVFPIVGVRTAKHLQDNIDALDIKLSEDELSRINKASNFSLGFPHDMIGQHPSESWLLSSSGAYAFEPHAKPF